MKLIDLRMAQFIRSVKVRIESYRQAHTYPPYGEVVGHGLYEINYKALQLSSPPEIESPFSGIKLPLMMDPKGNVYVDYGTDVLEWIQVQQEKLNQGEDLLGRLMADSPFVPAYSKPIGAQNGEPVYIK